MKTDSYYRIFFQKGFFTMTTKKLLACLMASLMACGALVSCGDKDKDDDKSSSSESSASEESSEESSESSAEDSESSDSSAEEGTKAPVAVDTGDFETPVAAESGDAYLAIVDGQWWIQYWGEYEDGSALAYDAGVVSIDGDGEYTVSVTADTNGFRYDTTGDVNGECIPSGCSFAAVRVKDGTTLYPDMAIEITSIKINGEEVEMLSKNYTSSDDGIEMRANIYNSYVSTTPEDAHDANGSVFGKDDEYSAQIVDPAVFADGWTNVEVTFNVTGTGGAAEGGDSSESAEDSSSEAADSEA